MWCGEYWKNLDVFLPDLPQYGCTRLQSDEFIPNDDSVLCHRCIKFVTQQQKQPALPPANQTNDNGTCLPPPSSSTPSSAPPTFDDVMECGILIHNELWFQWLQDEGVTPAPPKKQQQQQQEAGDDGVKGKKKKEQDPNKPTRSKHISYKKKLYPKLYQLAMESVKVAKELAIPAFPRMPGIKTKNISKTYHLIGEWVAQRRNLIKRADVHNMGETMDWAMEMINSEEYRLMDKFYVLDQDALFAHLFQKFGPKEGSTTEYTVDDYIRVMGVVFNNGSLREYLPDMIGKTKGGNRNEIDASRPGMRAGFRLLFDKFTDEEVHVILPPEWGTPDSIELIDKIGGPGTFQLHGNFNPNNLQRIGLPWEEKDVTALFKFVKNLYDQCMEKYTKGTGGGPGHPDNFNIWQERDAGWVTSYLNDQYCNLFLSAVHMWDKKYSFVLVKVVGSVPSAFQIDDCFDASVVDDDEDDDGGEFRIRRHVSPMPGSTSRSHISSSARKQNDMLVSHLGEMEKGRQATAANTTQLTTSVNCLVNHLITRGSSTGTARGSSTGAQASSTETEREIMDNINSTQDSIDRFEDKMNTLKKRKSETRCSKERAKITKQMEVTQKLVDNFNLMLVKYNAQLGDNVAGAIIGDVDVGARTEDDISDNRSIDENDDVTGARKEESESGDARDD